MKKIILVTGNPRKVGEAKLACKMFDIKVIQKQIRIIEIQSHDPIMIAKNKAETAFAQINKSLVVTDTHWNIPALNGFPGGYMKDVAKWFTSRDFLNLIENKQDRSVSFTESIIYKDIDQIRSFSKEYWGNLANKPRGAGNSIENVAEFDGVTLGERREQGGFSHALDEYIWYDFAKWYSKL